MRRRLLGFIRVVSVFACLACTKSSQREESVEMEPDEGTTAVDASAAAGDEAPSESEAVIPCSAAEWTQQCGSNCPFEPSEVDCAAACMNLSVVCGSGCPACMGMNLDRATCMAGCAQYRGVTCFNRLLGCFVTNTTCESESSCANANR